MRVLASPEGAADGDRLPSVSLERIRQGWFWCRKKSDNLGMTERTIRVYIEKEQDLYEELTTVMLTHGQYQGCYVMQYSETHEGGRTIAKFTLRESGCFAEGE